MSDEANGTNAPADATPAKKKRSPLRWLLRLALILVVGVVLLAVVAPMIASSDWGRGKVASIANDSIAGSVNLGAMKLSWFGSQAITDFVLSDPAGGEVVKFDSLTIDASLWALATGGRDLGEAKLTGLVVNVVADETGSSNLQRAIDTTRAGSSTSPTTDTGPGPGAGAGSGGGSALPVRVKFSAPQAKITVSQPGLEPVTALLNVAMETTGDDSVKLAIDGTARQGELVGKVDVAGQASGITQPKPTYAVAAVIQGLPVAGLEPFAGNHGLLVAGLGQTLDLDITAKADESTGGQLVTLKAVSKRLNADATVTIADDRVNARGLVNATATPALVALLGKVDAALAGLTLAGDVPVVVELESLAAPAAGFDPAATAVSANVTVGDGSITGNEAVGRVAWTNTTASVQSANLRESIKVDASSNLNVGGEDGRIMADATMKRLFDDAGGVAYQQADINGTVDVVGVPTAFVDAFAGTDGLLPEALGPTLKANVVVTSKPDEPINALVSVTSAHLVAEKLPFKVSDTIVFVPPRVVTWTATPALLAKLLPADGPKVAVDQPLKLQLLHLNVPTGDFDPAKVIAKLVIDTASIRVTSLDEVGDVTLSQPRVQIGGDHLGAIEATITASVQQRQGLIADASAAAASDVVISAYGVNVLGDEPAAELIEIDIAGGELAVKLAAAVDNGVVRLTESGMIKARVDAPMLARFGVTDAGGPTIARPVVVTVVPRELTAPVAFDPAKLQLAVDVGTSEIELTGDETLAGTTLDGLMGNVSIRGGESLAGNIGGRTRVPGADEPGKIVVEADLANWLDADGASDPLNATGTAKVRIEDLPTAFVAALGGPADLPTLIGDTIKLTVDYNAPSADQPKALAANVTAPKLVAEAGFRLADDKLSSSAPISAVWTLSPAAYTTLTRNEDGTPMPLTLVEPVRFNLTVSRLSDLPTSGEFDIRQLALAAAFRVSPVKVRDTQTQGVATLSGTTGTISATPLGTAVTAKVNGNVSYIDPTLQQPATGELMVDAALSRLFDEQAQFAADAANIGVGATLSKMPIVALDQLVAAEGRLLALLGGQADLKIATDIKQGAGPVTLTVTSPNTNVNFPGRYDEGKLTLVSDAVVTTKVTRELGQKLLKDINFILESAYSSDKPIKLTVPAQGFVVPVEDFAIDNVSAANVKLELGTINLENRGPLALLMKLARRQNARQMQAEFSPLIVSLKNGKVHHENRLDTLIDGSFHLVTFGDIDLARQQLDMVVGLTADTLDDVFGAEGLDPRLVYQIPVTGPQAKPNIDIGKAGVELGTLRERTKLAKDNPLLGGLLNALLGELFGKNKPVPAQSQTPLPWAGNTQSRAEPPQRQPTQADTTPEQQPKEPPKESVEEKLIKEGLKRLFE